MKFLKRIKKKACEYIELEESESDTYNGAGYCFAYVVNGKISKFIYLSDVSSSNRQIDDALNHGEVYFGMASCHTLCEPRLIQKSDSTLIAKITRLFGEEIV